jgi:hypothetical protein
MMAKLFLKSAFGYLLGITRKQIKIHLVLFIHSVKPMAILHFGIG